MYNFYNLNPELHTSSNSSSSSITLDVNLPLTNDTFYMLFEKYYSNPSEANQDMLAKHLNVTHYLICFIPNDTTDDVSLLKNITISSMDDLNLLICTTEEREVFLPVFTDSRELQPFTQEPLYTLSVPAKWLWKFALAQKNFNGIVFNPGSIGWDISLEHISSLLEDIRHSN